MTTIASTTIAEVSAALQRIADDPSRSEDERASARQSLEHIAAGRVAAFALPETAPIERREIEPCEVKWFTCLGCGGRAGVVDTGERRGAVHVPPSCTMFVESSAAEFRRVHNVEVRET